MADFAARIELQGLSKLDALLATFPEAVLAEIEKTQKTNALDLQSEARGEVQRGARSGRIYKRGKRGVHQASAPDEPPKSDSGYLVSRIRGFVEDRFTAALEAGTKYARMLQFGTRKMAPRPYMDRAAAIVQPRASERLKAAIRRGTKLVAGG